MSTKSTKNLLTVKNYLYFIAAAELQLNFSPHFSREKFKVKSQYQIYLIYLTNDS